MKNTVNQFKKNVKINMLAIMLKTAMKNGSYYSLA